MTYLDEVRERLDSAMMREVEQTRKDISNSARQVSNTVADTLIVEPLVEGKTAIMSPYFFSRILDEGRGAAYPRSAGALVWYTNALEMDPRLQGDWFRTEARARSSRLNIPSAEFQSKVRSGEIVVAQRSGPVSPSNFVDEGTQRVRGEAGMKKAILDELSAIVRDSIRENPLSVSIKFRF